MGFRFSIRDWMWLCVVVGLVITLLEHIYTDAGRESMLQRRNADRWITPTMVYRAGVDGVPLR